MPAKRVVITGLGLVSSLGFGARTAWKNLLGKACAIGPIHDAGFSELPCRIAGVVDDDALEERLAPLVDVADRKTMSRASLFTMLAADEALCEADWNPVEASECDSTGVSIGVSLDGMQEISDTSLRVRDRGAHRGVGPYFLLRMLSNMAGAHVAMKYNFRGPQLCCSTACATGAQAIGDGFHTIRNGNAKVMVCGAAEAPINVLTMAAFCKIRAIATKFNDAPSLASRPFDAKRQGFVFAEGAAVIVLEELEHALLRGAKPVAEVLGFGTSGDGYHLTAPRPDGSAALRCMQAALRDARLTAADLGFINAHATSTPVGDTVETRAIADLTHGLPPVPVTSNKGATGHLISACGSVEAIFTALSCAEGVIPLTLNLTDPDTAAVLDFVIGSNREWPTEPHGRRVALSNSFGFGGANASLCISQFV